MGDPPEDAYGLVTNPERFAPSISAADELIRDLVSRFDVTISRGQAAPSKSKSVATLESVLITPVRRDQSPLTITESTLRELAEYSEALTAGQLSEHVTSTLRPVLEHSWEGNDWGRQPPRDGRWRPCSRTLHS